MKPSAALASKRDQLSDLATRHRASNLRVFGSVLHGDDGETSDLDLLIDALPEATLFDLGALYTALETLLGVRVDLVTPGDLSPEIRARVLAEAESV